ncbi:unnamed protein product [Alopecurus aequalis]
MGSFARAARFLVLLQIVMFIISAVMMSGSVAAARGISGGALDPNLLPVCTNGSCRGSGQTYTRPCPKATGCIPSAGQP